MPFDVVLVIKRLSGKKRYMYHMYHSNLEIPREMNSRLFPLDIIKGSESRKLCKNRQRKKPAAAVHRVLKYEVLPLFKVLYVKLICFVFWQQLLICLLSILNY